jgi:hypothetical protein
MLVYPQKEVENKNNNVFSCLQTYGCAIEK